MGIDGGSCSKGNFNELESKYNNFYAPAFELIVDEQNVLRKGIEVASISVSDGIDKPSQFSFSVSNVFDPVNKEFNSAGEFFTPGKGVSIKMGYTDKLELMMVGLISSVKVSFPAGGTPKLDITGMDYTETLMKNKKSAQWKEMKHSEVVNQIVSKINTNASSINFSIEETKIKYPVVVKEEQKSDYDFIKELAKQNCFEFFMREDTIYFREQPRKDKPVGTLEWARNLLSFSPEVNMNKQVAQVKVIGYDYKTKKAITVTVPQGSEIEKEPGTKTGAELAKEIYGEDAVVTIKSNAKTLEEAELEAKVAFKERAGKLVTGSGEALGIPEIKSGRYIELDGLGKKFSRKYYITSSTHTISNSGYKTSFQVEVDSI